METEGSASQQPGTPNLPPEPAATPSLSAPESATTPPKLAAPALAPPVIGSAAAGGAGTPPSGPSGRPKQDPRRRAGGRGWIFATLFLAVAVVFLLMAQLGSALMSFAGPGFGSRSGPRFQESIYRDASSRHKIVVIDVDGIIADFPVDGSGRTMVLWLKDQLERAGDDGSVKAVVVRIDSPGGEVLASDEMNKAFAEFQARTGKPVVTSMGSVAASGGYYIAAPSRWIVANELTITGSIGVIIQTYNYRGLMDKVGLRPEVFKSGKFKDMLSGDRAEVPQEERDMVQALVNESFARFKRVVQDGRERAARLNAGAGRPLADDWEEYVDGRVFSGRQAHELGFVDELGNFDVAVERAERLAGIADAKLIRYQLEFDLASLFRILGKTDAAKIRLDWGVEPPNIRAGRLYFLAPTFIR